MATQHRPKHTRIQHNLVAARIREQFPTGSIFSDKKQREQEMIERSILAQLAIKFAESFSKDNPNFDPLKFMDACSPDTVNYPLSELWETNGD